MEGRAFYKQLRRAAIVALLAAARADAQDSASRVAAASLTLPESLTVLAASRAAAAKIGVFVSCAVVDASGQPLAVQRMDNARFYTPDFARGKAMASAISGGPSANAKVQNVKPSPPGNPYAVRGAVPLLRDGTLVGAIGCSGGTPEQDEEIAQAGQVSAFSSNARAGSTKPGQARPLTATPRTAGLLTLDDAVRIVDVAVQTSSMLDLCVGIAVVDARGDAIAAVRMTCGGSVSGGIGKAVAAAFYGRPTAELGQLATSRMTQDLNEATGRRMNFLQGGVPIFRSGQLVGAIGVSGGGSSQYDEEIGVAGINAVF